MNKEKKKDTQTEFEFRKKNIDNHKKFEFYRTNS
jgi:hypothetical protein